MLEDSELRQFRPRLKLSEFSTCSIDIEFLISPRLMIPALVVKILKKLGLDSSCLISSSEALSVSRLRMDLMRMGRVS